MYCKYLQTSYLLPPDLFEGRSNIWLRTSPAKNGQRASLNWAADYEFSGAVAQLAERFAGSEEARGSNPLSSTPSEDPAPAVESVGAHEFRNHFGFYMEQAAKGTEVQVSKRGQPFVRLLGAGSDLPLETPGPDEDIR